MCIISLDMYTNILVIILKYNEIKFILTLMDGYSLLINITLDLHSKLSLSRDFAHAS